MSAEAPRLAKVPAVTLLFWVIKVAATTLGETAGDAASMSMDLGYLTATVLFGVVFLVVVGAQIRAARFHPWLYWAAIVATTTVGTTLADFADRSLGIGYAGGTTLLALLVAASLLAWRRVHGSIAVSSVDRPGVEAFYWVTIMFSQTLGTALGDWTADEAGLGYLRAGLVFAALLAAVAAAARLRPGWRPAMFWLAFILTRPLGAVLGDFLDKPLAHGGLALDRYAASGVLAAFMVGCLLLFRQRPAARAH